MKKQDVQLHNNKIPCIQKMKKKSGRKKQPKEQEKPIAFSIVLKKNSQQ